MEGTEGHVCERVKCDRCRSRHCTYSEECIGREDILLRKAPREHGGHGKRSRDRTARCCGTKCAFTNFGGVRPTPSKTRSLNLGRPSPTCSDYNCEYSYTIAWRKTVHAPNDRSNPEYGELKVGGPAVDPLQAELLNATTSTLCGTLTVHIRG